MSLVITDPVQMLTASAGRLKQAAVFCLTNGMHLYKNWTPVLLFKYLAFQFLTGGMVISWGRRDIEGVFIAWRADSADIRKREAAGEFHFNWQFPPWEADSLLLADVVIERTSKAENNKRVSRLVQKASAQWPDWKMRRIFTHRRGRLVELTPAVLTRFLAHVSPENS